MFFVHFLFALFIALLITLFFALMFRRRHPCPIFIFFLIVFLGTWAGGVWIMPMGPTFWNVYWLPFFFSGLIFSLLFAVTISSRSDRLKQNKKKPIKEEGVAKAALGSFFWALILTLILGIIMHYLGYRVPPIQPILPMK